MLSSAHPPDSMEFIAIVSTRRLKIQTPRSKAVSVSGTEVSIQLPCLAPFETLASVEDARSEYCRFEFCESAYAWLR
jgi:hypothetical protein